MNLIKNNNRSAKVFANKVDRGSINQVKEMLELEYLKDSNLVFMPDIHKGHGCVIGTTIANFDQMDPRFVGNDIGCGVTTYIIDKKKDDIDLLSINKYIVENIPMGMNFRDITFDEIKDIPLQDLNCYNKLDREYIERSLGTLGGGNHFIEIGELSDGRLTLSVHSGSRGLGATVFKHYRNINKKIKKDKYKESSKKIIKKLKEEGKEPEIEGKLKKLKEKIDKTFYNGVLQGQYLKKYLNDIDIVQQYAKLNRKLILEEIIGYMVAETEKEISSTHNYIDVENNIVRKGAISAYKGEELVIPLSPKDGIIIGVGKGNPEWNYSAPHGAGRVMSRTEAFETISLDNYKKSMKGVQSLTVNKKTLDEAPKAYKNKSDIVDLVVDTIDIIDVSIPILSVKDDS